MSHAVKIEKVINFPVEEATDVHAAEAQRCRDQVDVLSDMAGFEKDEAIATISVLEDGTFEDGSDEKNQLGVDCELRLDDPPRDCLSEIPFAEQPEVMFRCIVMIETRRLSIDVCSMKENLKRVQSAAGGDNSKRSGQICAVIRSTHSIREMEECRNLAERQRNRR